MSTNLNKEMRRLLVAGAGHIMPGAGNALGRIQVYSGHANGAEGALVEVDVKTGETRVLKVIAACDVGRVMNPLALLGQVEGSISMGLGMALQENFVMQEGKVLTDSLFKCNLPTIDQTPQVITFFVEHETADGPYGAKGVGELASIPTAPAIVNAIYNATGVRCYNLPADKKWLKAQLEAHRAEGNDPASS